ncbi:MAG: hypothetical protein HQ525_10550 [Anaerolineae bacterium]|nr:hypothetical protein [Anaerolineae bacterium]
MKRFTLLFLLVILLTACSSTRSPSTQPTIEAFVTATLPSMNTPWPTSSANPVTATPTDNPSIMEQLFPSSNAGNELTRMDEQGMVIIEITPLNLGMPDDDTLDFNVSLNTHSVDLSMDLAQLSVITTDTGGVIQAISWDGPSGGHHVTGKLLFPATKDGISILDGVSRFTLQIRDLDADNRTFEWQLK